MIQPFRLWKMPDRTEEEQKRKTSAERAHDDLILELCMPLGMKLVAALPRIASAMAKARAEAYNRSLAVILRHLDVTKKGRGVDPIWDEAQRCILETFNRQWAAHGIDDLPAPLELVISSDYALSFPGGVEIRDTFKTAHFLKDAGVDLYEFELIRWDAYFRDSMARIAYEILRDTPDDQLDTPASEGSTLVSKRLLREHLSDPKHMPKETNFSRVRQNWIKAGRKGEWDDFVRYVQVCRRAVVMPRAKKKGGA